MRGVQLRRLQGQPQRFPQHGRVRQLVRGQRRLQGHVPPAQGAGALPGQAAEVVREREREREREKYI